MSEQLLKRKFRTRVRNLIKNHDGTWVAIAKDIGIPYGSLQALVSGKIYLPNPKMTTLVKLAKYFEINLTWLITGEEQ